MSRLLDDAYAAVEVVLPLLRPHEQVSGNDDHVLLLVRPTVEEGDHLPARNSSDVLDVAACATTCRQAIPKWDHRVIGLAGAELST